LRGNYLKEFMAQKNHSNEAGRLDIIKEILKLFGTTGL